MRAGSFLAHDFIKPEEWEDYELLRKGGMPESGITLMILFERIVERHRKLWNSGAIEGDQSYVALPVIKD